MILELQSLKKYIDARANSPNILTLEYQKTQDEFTWNSDVTEMEYPEFSRLLKFFSIF
jgi:hypothetical protein